MSGKIFQSGVLFGSPLINITPATVDTIRGILYPQFLSGGTEIFNFRIINCDFTEGNKLIQTQCALWYYTVRTGLSVNYVLYPQQSKLIQQDGKINVLNSYGDALYGEMNLSRLAFENIVTCAHREVDNAIVSQPEYRLVKHGVVSDIFFDQYHSFVFLNLS